MSYHTECFKSRVTNRTGATRTFTFLPFGGATLLDGETKEYLFDLRAVLGQTIGRKPNMRKLDAFNNAVARGDIDVSFGNPIVTDDNGNARMIYVNNGQVLEGAPCYDTVSASAGS